MAILRCYVDERTHAILIEQSRRLGRSVEDLAECAIAEAAPLSVPPDFKAAQAQREGQK